MIIVSQDKEKLVNFDNVTELYIVKLERDFYIRIETNNGACKYLGKYETLERAKEVLTFIYKVYSDQTLIKHINPEFQNRLIAGDKNKYFDIYEMPED